MRAAAPLLTSPAIPATTYAGLLWPSLPGRGLATLRAVLLTLFGSGILVLSAKIQVPGPVPMTLQTLAVMALGATLGFRLATGAVLAYMLEGLVGLPVFANTPPLVAGPAYLTGPTGGFLLGFLVAAAIVGAAADRGLMKRPLAFASVLVLANVALLAAGCLWLAFLAQTASGAHGIGLVRAFEVGARPFLIGNTIKLALAAVALPLVFETLARWARR